MSNQVYYKAVNLATATPVSVTTVPSELISIRPSVVMSAHAVTVLDGASGTLVGTLTASSAVTAKFEYDGITLNNGIQLVPNASSTGTVIVAYRLI
jgi:hypothetical protein